MKKPVIDVIVIILITISLAVLNEMDYLENFAKFMLIPMVAFYYLGQYVERKFRSK